MTRDEIIVWLACAYLVQPLHFIERAVCAIVSNDMQVQKELEIELWNEAREWRKDGLPESESFRALIATVALLRAARFKLAAAAASRLSCPASE